MSPQCACSGAAGVWPRPRSAAGFARLRHGLVWPMSPQRACSGTAGDCPRVPLASGPRRVCGPRPPNSSLVGRVGAWFVFLPVSAQSPNHRHFAHPAPYGYTPPFLGGFRLQSGATQWRCCSGHSLGCYVSLVYLHYGVYIFLMDRHIWQP